MVRFGRRRVEESGRGDSSTLTRAAAELAGVSASANPAWGVEISGANWQRPVPNLALLETTEKEHRRAEHKRPSSARIDPAALLGHSQSFRSTAITLGVELSHPEMGTRRPALHSLKIIITRSFSHAVESEEKRDSL